LTRPVLSLCPPLTAARRRPALTVVGAWVLGLLGAVFLLAEPARAAAWPQDAPACQRNFGDLSAGIVLGEAHAVTWQLAADTGRDLSRFFVSEQYPAWVAVTGVEADVDGAEVSVYHEVGAEGEVLPGLVPHRFVFWEPGSGWLDLTLQPGETLTVRYTVASDEAGTFAPEHDGWCGLLDGQAGAGGWDDAVPLLCFHSTPVVLDEVSLQDGGGFLQIAWTLHDDGEDPVVRLQRGGGPDPWLSQPLPGAQWQGPGAYVWKDGTVQPGRLYHYWLALLDAGGRVREFLALGAAQLDSPGTPCRLRPAYPNPFNPVTMLRFALDAERRVELAVHDARGRRLRRLAAGTWPAGEHALVWDGRDERGRELPSGVYFARLAVERRPAQVIRLTLVR